MTTGSGWPVALRVEDGLEPQIVLRPLTRRDRRVWVELRSQNAFWLRPWDATRPDRVAPRVLALIHISSSMTARRNIWC